MERERREEGGRLRTGCVLFFSSFLRSFFLIGAFLADGTYCRSDFSNLNSSTFF